MARNQPKKMIKLQFYLQLLVIFQLKVSGITFYNPGYGLESSLLAIALK